MEATLRGAGFANVSSVMFEMVPVNAACVLGEAPADSARAL
jgi:hypothetical protein